MKRNWSGRRRRVTDAQIRRIREWKPLRQLAKEVGLTAATAHFIRSGYQYKQPSP